MPYIVSAYTTKAVSGQKGNAVNTITRRDWFAAQAPAVPDWFEWAPADPMPEYPDPHQRLTDEQRGEWDGLGDWLDDKDVDPAVLAFRDEYRAACAASTAWHNRKTLGREVAWRWHWADAMLATAPKPEGGAQ